MSGQRQGMGDSPRESNDDFIWCSWITYFDGREWRFWSSSSKAFRDLSQYYHPNWNCHRWRVTEPILEASPSVKERVVGGYSTQMDTRISPKLETRWQ